MKAALQNCVRLSVALVCCIVAACSNEPQAPPKVATSVPRGEASEDVPGEVLISAAASTKELIEQLAAEFSKTSSATIRVNSGPSSGLATQILEGAPTDLYLSANREWAAQVVDAELADSQKELLTNKLVLIVPKGNPAEIKEPRDLLGDKVKKIALAGERVPAGMYADQALTQLELLEKLTAHGKIARAQDVRGALSFVERGEAEAGIVYSTDVNVVPNVEVVHEFDPALHDEIVYVLVLLRRGVNNPAAQSFFKFLQSSDADAIYSKAGFSRLK